MWLWMRDFSGSTFTLNGGPCFKLCGPRIPGERLPGAHTVRYCTRLQLLTCHCVMCTEYERYERHWLTPSDDDCPMPQVR